MSQHSYIPSLGKSLFNDIASCHNSTKSKKTEMLQLFFVFFVFVVFMVKVTDICASPVVFVTTALNSPLT
jgi:hypothetical protein